AVGLVHGANAFVALHLRFDGVIVGAGCRTEARVQGVGKNVDIFKWSAAGVIVPGIVNGPDVVFADHSPNALDRRNGRSHTGFGVEAIGSAAAALVALAG